jgi:hypothetical protein
MTNESSGAIEIDAELIEELMRSSSAIAEKGLNALSENLRSKLAGMLASGSLYLHVQLHPAPSIVLAFDPSDPHQAPLRDRQMGTRVGGF